MASKDYNLKENNLDGVTLGISGFRGLGKFLDGERIKMLVAIIVVFMNSALGILAPYLIGIAIDQYVIPKDVDGLLRMTLIIGAVYFTALFTNYFQIVLTGRVGQRTLFKIRAAIFTKLQELPLQFFNQTKSGDLVSRINSDTEKVNTLFAEVIIQTVSALFTVVGVFIFVIYLNWQLGVALVLVCSMILGIVYLLTPLTQRLNKETLERTGDFSGEMKENLTNFKAVIAFNKREYFVKNVETFNKARFKASIKSGIINTMAYPLLQFGNNMAQLVVLVFGIYLIEQGNLTIGLLVSYLAYVNQLFNPLQTLAGVWPIVQTAIAAWRRISEILDLENNLTFIKSSDDVKLQNIAKKGEFALEAKSVNFEYEEGKPIIKDLNLQIRHGEKVALIGPTGGGKSTIASLLRHLYDTTSGELLLYGRDIREYTEEELSKIFGYILQDPILFSGTVGENIAYALDFAGEYDEKVLETKINEIGLSHLLVKFKDGLGTKVSPESEDISLGQRQIIAFIRALLRKPKILILDEATANIDTITENQLEEVIEKLPQETTMIIIAHRLSTIESADEIVFISNGVAQKAMSFDDALNLVDNHQESRS